MSGDIPSTTRKVLESHLTELEKAKEVISARISKAREKDQGCHDIRYNLMSVVPNKQLEIEKQCNKLKKMIKNFSQVKPNDFRPDLSVQNCSLDTWKIKKASRPKNITAYFII